MMTAVFVDGSATRYWNVPVLGSKTGWIVGSAVVAAVLYDAEKFGCLMGETRRKRGDDGRGRNTVGILVEAFRIGTRSAAVINGARSRPVVARHLNAMSAPCWNWRAFMLSE